MLEFFFFALLSLIAYACVLFPLIVLLRALVWKRPYASADVTPPVSLIVACHNEAEHIESKLDNILALDYPIDCLEILIASDGSDDGTDEIVRGFVQRYPTRHIRLFTLPRGGKAAALNATVPQATGEILVFSDANSQFALDAVRVLVRPFADPEVGGVAGNQVYEKQRSGGPSEAGERSYWSYDRALKQAESTAGSTISGTGAIYAIRRSLFEPAPPDVTDDFAISTGVITRGYRLVFEPAARAYEPVMESARAEFHRKVRIATRGLRSVLLRRQLLNPLRHGFYSLQLFSHKVLRRLLAVPLLALLLVSLLMWDHGWFYRVAAVAQASWYVAAGVGFLLGNTWVGRFPLVSVPYYFCMVNAASLWAAWNIVRGHRIQRWSPQRNANRLAATATATAQPSRWTRLIEDRRISRVWVVGGIGLVFLATWGLIQYPLLIVIIGAAAVAWAILQRSERATPLVLFVLYSNLAVVAVKFHGVPYIVATMVPALLFIPMFDQLLVRRNVIIVGRCLPWILLYLLIQLVCGLASRRPELAFEAVLSGTLEGLVLYILITNLLRSEAMLRLSVWALLLAGVIMGGVPLFQYVTGTYDGDYGGLAQVERDPLKIDGVEIPGRFNPPRLAGPIGEKNRFAQVMLMLVPLGMLMIWNEPTRLARQLAIVATFIITIGGTLAFSRGAIVGQVVLLGIAVSLGYVTRRQLATVVMGVVLLLLVTPQYWARLASIPSGLLLFQGRNVAASADGAIRGRATEMGAAALAFRDHLIFGVGPGMFPSYSQEYGERVGFRALKEERRAHSLYLEVAAETGIFGIGCMLAIFGFTLRDLSRVRNRCLVTRPELSRTATAFLLTVVAYGTTAVFLHLAYARYFWIIIAMSDAVTWIAANTRPSSDQSP